MSSAQSRRHRHVGVFLPVESSSDNPDRVANEWPVINNTHVASKGFLLADVVAARSLVLVVQSVQTGELLVQKFMRPNYDDPDLPEYQEPLELRVSTWQDTLPSGQFPNAVPLGVLPRDAPFFNKLQFWQYYTPPDDGNTKPAYSLYFEHCNGGDLLSFIEKYNDRNLAVPEHFIWLVAEQLCLAIAWLHFGERPDVPGYQAPANWTTLYHRDLFPNNIFINYPPRGPGRTPAAGVVSEALPQIVVGDFGNSACEGDDPTMLPLNVCGGESSDDTELRVWEDTYGAGCILRRLCQAHLPYDEGGVGTADWCTRRPDNIRMTDLNARDGSAPDFSDQLVGLLGNFEWEFMETGTEINEVDDPLGQVTATSRWMVNTLYPAARARVAAYRNPPTGRPAGYFDGLDVSWTRPAPLMPFVYNTDHATAAGDGPVDGDDEDDEGHADGEEFRRMQQLAGLHQWEDVKPRYELRSLEFGGPTIRPMRHPPPHADGEGDDQGG